MNWTLENKTAVITGGAVGIGFEISKFCLDKHAKIVILDIDENAGEAAVKKLNLKYGANSSYFIKCDVTRDLESISKILFEKYKFIDVLVNNAGIAVESNVSKLIDINVTSVIEWTFKFYRHMRIDAGGKGGTIINMASIYGFKRDPFSPVYKASKYAVMGFTRTLGHSFNFDRTGVRIVAVCPGFTHTALTSNIPEGDDEILNKHMQDFLEKEVLWQNADVVGKAVVDVYETAKSGTAWWIEGGQPIREVL